MQEDFGLDKPKRRYSKYQISDRFGFLRREEKKLEIRTPFRVRIFCHFRYSFIIGGAFCY